MPTVPLQMNGFERLLMLLDATDRERAGARYEELRAALIRFFRWRGCGDPEALADEAMTRAAERAVDDEAIRDIGRFLHGIARLLVFEDHRRRVREEQLAREEKVVQIPERSDDSRLECLDECLAQLSSAERELIVAYYDGTRGEKIANRQRLASSLSVSLAALRVRTHRLREQLETCLHGCLSGRVK